MDGQPRSLRGSGSATSSPDPVGCRFLALNGGWPSSACPPIRTSFQKNPHPNLGDRPYPCRVFGRSPSEGRMPRARAREPTSIHAHSTRGNPCSTTTIPSRRPWAESWPCPSRVSYLQRISRSTNAFRCCSTSAGWISTSNRAPKERARSNPRDRQEQAERSRNPPESRILVEEPGRPQGGSSRSRGAGAGSQKERPREPGAVTINLFAPNPQRISAEEPGISPGCRIPRGRIASGRRVPEVVLPAPPPRPHLPQVVALGGGVGDVLVGAVVGGLAHLLPLRAVPAEEVEVEVDTVGL